MTRPSIGSLVAATATITAQLAAIPTDLALTPEQRNILRREIGRRLRRVTAQIGSHIAERQAERHLRALLEG